MEKTSFIDKLKEEKDWAGAVLFTSDGKIIDKLNLEPKEDEIE